MWKKIFLIDYSKLIMHDECVVSLVPNSLYALMDHVLLMAYGDSIIAQSLAIIYIYILRILLRGAFETMVKEYKIFIFYEK